jgi:hypothetical protein
MSVAGQAGDLDAYLRHDVRFHPVLLEASGNEMLASRTGVVAEVLTGGTPGQGQGRSNSGRSSRVRRRCGREAFMTAGCTRGTKVRCVLDGRERTLHCHHENALSPRERRSRERHDSLRRRDRPHRAAGDRHEGSAPSRHPARLARRQLVAEHSGLCVELAGGDGLDHVEIWHNTCDTGYAQLWEFR